MSDRDRQDLVLTAKIEAIHRRSPGVNGSPNIHDELAVEHEIRVGRKSVLRLRRAAGLRGATLRRYIVTTQPKCQRAQGAVDLTKRKFLTDGPDRLWVPETQGACQLGQGAAHCGGIPCRERHRRRCWLVRAGEITAVFALRGLRQRRVSQPLADLRLCGGWSDGSNLAKRSKHGVSCRSLFHASALPQIVAGGS